MGSGNITEDDEANAAYLEFGDVSSVDLIDFAYQITSGMVIYSVNMYALLQQSHTTAWDLINYIL